MNNKGSQYLIIVLRRINLLICMYKVGKDAGLIVIRCAVKLK